MPIGPGTNNSQQVIAGDSSPFNCQMFINSVSFTQKGEAHTVPGSSPYQVTIAPPNSDTFLVDLGVTYAGGSALTRVGGSSPTLSAGQYSVFLGVYTFAAADEGQAILISYTHTNGVCDVSFTVTLNNSGETAGGAVKMNPTDPAAKLLYNIRGACLGLMKGMTWQQYMPLLSNLTSGYGNASNATAALPAAGAGFQIDFAVDMLAILPENPGNLGL